MSTLKPTKKISRRQELRQDTVVTFSAKVWDYVDKNRNVAYGILGVVVLIIAGIIGYSYLLRQWEVEAQEFLAPAVQLYEKGQYRTALDGANGEYGLIAIADEFGSTNAGNLARFYAADALFRLGEYDQALEFFEEFEADDNYLGASALAGQAAIHEATGDYARAGRLYKRAALLFPNEVTSPGYLIEAGRAFELAGDYGNAVDAYESVSKDYPESTAAHNVDLLVARAEAKQTVKS